MNLHKAVAVAVAALAVSGCATSYSLTDTKYGNSLYQDCITGFFEASHCFVEARGKDGRTKSELIVTYDGVVKQLVNAGAAVGAAYLIGEGLEESGDEVNVSGGGATATATAAASANSVAGASAVSSNKKPKHGNDNW